MKIISEFKEFAVKGNVIDMAVGIVVGGAFGKIVSSFVANVVTPPIGLLVGGVNFNELAITLKAADGAQKAVTLNYGMFIQSVFDFVIIAFAIFIAVKAINAAKKKEEAAPAQPPRNEVLLEEIRDLLKK